jgi:hypothetical protein
MSRPLAPLPMSVTAQYMLTPPPPPSLLALGNTGSPNIASALLPLVQHPSEEVRFAALVGTRRLSADLTVDAILSVLVPPHADPATHGHLDIRTLQAALDAVALHASPSPLVVRALLGMLDAFDDLHGLASLGCHDECSIRCSLPSAHAGQPGLVRDCRRACHVACLNVDAYGALRCPLLHFLVLLAYYLVCVAVLAQDHH